MDTFEKVVVGVLLSVFVADWAVGVLSSRGPDASITTLLSIVLGGFGAHKLLKGKSDGSDR